MPAAKNHENCGHKFLRRGKIGAQFSQDGITLDVEIGEFGQMVRLSDL
jgi:hypothetical protein